MKTKITINRHKINSNKKNNIKENVISCKTYKKTIYANKVKISGPCTIIYSPEKPLKCGATVWIETDSDVIVLDM